jgi:hypothetical protein
LKIVRQKRVKELPRWRCVFMILQLREAGYGEQQTAPK